MAAPTAGEWYSADKRWYFRRRPEGWLIHPGGSNRCQMLESKQVLEAAGLLDVAFESRAAAVAALELALQLASAS